MFFNNKSFFLIYIYILKVYLNPKCSYLVLFVLALSLIMSPSFKVILKNVSE
jgi:hypothetical protein